MFKLLFPLLLCFSLKGYNQEFEFKSDTVKLITFYYRYHENDFEEYYCRYFFYDHQLYDADYFKNYNSICISKIGGNSIWNKIIRPEYGNLDELKNRHIDLKDKKFETKNHFLNTHFLYSVSAFVVKFYFMPCDKNIINKENCLLDNHLNNPSGFLPISYDQKSFKEVQLPSEIFDIINTDSISIQKRYSGTIEW